MSDDISVFLHYFSFYHPPFFTVIEFLYCLLLFCFHPLFLIHCCVLASLAHSQSSPVSMTVLPSSLAALLPSHCQCDVLHGGIFALFPFYFFPLYSFPQKTYSLLYIHLLHLHGLLYSYVLNLCFFPCILSDISTWTSH